MTRNSKRMKTWPSFLPTHMQLQWKDSPNELASDSLHIKRISKGFFAYVWLGSSFLSSQYKNYEQISQKEFVLLVFMKKCKRKYGNK